MPLAETIPTKSRAARSSVAQPQENCRARPASISCKRLAHQRFRRTGDRAGAARAARNVAGLAWWHPLEPNDVQRGIDLFEAHSGLDGRDAVFAALALNRGIDAILATDRAFDEVDGLERIDPADQQAVAALAGPAT